MKKETIFAVLLFVIFILSGCTTPEPTGETSLLDDLDLLAETVRGLSDLEVEELLGKPDAQGSGTFSYGYDRPDGTRTVIYFERETRTVQSVKNEGRYLAVQAIERPAQVQALLDDPELLWAEADNMDFLAFRDLLGDPDEVMYTPTRSECYLNSDGQAVWIYFSDDKNPAVIRVEFNGQIVPQNNG